MHRAASRNAKQTKCICIVTMPSYIHVSDVVAMRATRHTGTSSHHAGVSLQSFIHDTIPGLGLVLETDVLAITKTNGTLVCSDRRVCRLPAGTATAPPRLSSTGTPTRD
eukprot:GHVU01135545.1.p1 GENE.GHVU01135545.1~~GHVU01135545.1.p1  ORF type:complete len:109 (-),score=3.01 GHVU01135545.1:749-1075(-)